MHLRKLFCSHLCEAHSAAHGGVDGHAVPALVSLHVQRVVLQRAGQENISSQHNKQTAKEHPHLLWCPDQCCWEKSEFLVCVYTHTNLKRSVCLLSCSAGREGLQTGNQRDTGPNGSARPRYYISWCNSKSSVELIIMHRYLSFQTNISLPMKIKGNISHLIILQMWHCI